MVNPLKHLPKLYKRDLAKDKLVWYTAVIDGTPTKQFPTKAMLYKHIAELQSQNPIKEISMFKTIVQSLIH